MKSSSPLPEGIRSSPRPAPVSSPKLSITEFMDALESVRRLGHKPTVSLLEKEVHAARTESPSDLTPPPAPPASADAVPLSAPDLEPPPAAQAGIYRATHGPYATELIAARNREAASRLREQQLEERIDRLVAAESTLQTRLDEVTRQLTEHETAATRAQSELERSHARLSELETELATARHREETLTVELTRTAAEVARIGALTAEIDAKRTELDRLAGLMRELTAQRDDAAARAETAADLQRQLARREAEHRDELTRREETQADLAQSREALRAEAAESAALRRTVDALERERDDARQSANSALANVAATEHQLRALQAELSDHQQTLRELERTRSDLDTLQALEVTLRDNLALLRTRNAALEADLDASREAARRAADERLHLREELDLAGRELATLRTQLAAPSPRDVELPAPPSPARVLRDRLRALPLPPIVGRHPVLIAATVLPALAALFVLPFLLWPRSIEGVINAPLLTLTSPLDGTVTTLSAQSGEAVSAGAALFEIENLRDGDRGIREAEAALVAKREEITTLENSRRYLESLYANLGPEAPAAGRAKAFPEAPGTRAPLVIGGNFLAETDGREKREDLAGKLAEAALRLDTAKAELQVALTRVDTERSLFERTARATVRAPSAGVVRDIRVGRGGEVARGSVLCTVVNSDQPYVEAFVSDDVFARLKIGQNADILIDGAERPLTGVVTALRAAAAEAGPESASAVALGNEAERPRVQIQISAADLRRELGSALQVGRPVRVNFP